MSLLKCHMLEEDAMTAADVATEAQRWFLYRFLNKHVETLLRPIDAQRLRPEVVKGFLFKYAKQLINNGSRVRCRGVATPRHRQTLAAGIYSCHDS